MASRFGGSRSGNAGRTRSAMGRRAGLPSMSEKQAQAYLIARDLVRRIQRTCSLVTTALQGAPGIGDRVQSASHQGRSIR